VDFIKLIEDWIIGITHSQEALSQLPICPYAKQAYINKTYQIISATYDNVESEIRKADLKTYQVVVILLEDYEKFSCEQLQQRTLEFNKLFNGLDIVVLDNDPRDPMYINGIRTTFEYNYLWIIQPLADLNEKSLQLNKTLYYKHWTQEQYQDVVAWRFDAKK
jgi:hypothetical protein